MELGERIYQYRTERRMSQDSLAEKLDVSRQSVSKWETGSSVPDLDKLMKLSELFGVTLDELVKGTSAQSPQPETEPAPQPPAPQPSRGGTSRIIGAVLLCAAAVIAVLCLMLGGGGMSLYFAAPFAACGIICLAAKKHPGLWCAWAVFCIVELYLRWGTGIRWSLIWMTVGYQPEWNYMRLAVAWGMTVIPLVLAGVTVWAFRGRVLTYTVKSRNLILAGWVLLFAVRWGISYIPVPLWTALYRLGGLLPALCMALLDWVWLALAIALAVRTLALRRGWKESRQSAD